VELQRAGVPPDGHRARAGQPAYAARAPRQAAVVRRLRDSGSSSTRTSTNSAAIGRLSVLDLSCNFSGMRDLPAILDQQPDPRAAGLLRQAGAAPPGPGPDRRAARGGGVQGVGAVKECMAKQWAEEERRRAGKPQGVHARAAADAERVVAEHLGVGRQEKVVGHDNVAEEAAFLQQQFRNLGRCFF
jgi:hypothetical protein